MGLKCRQLDQMDKLAEEAQRLFKDLKDAAPQAGAVPGVDTSQSSPAVAAPFDVVREYENIANQDYVTCMGRRLHKYQILHSSAKALWLREVEERIRADERARNAATQDAKPMHGVRRLNLPAVSALLDYAESLLELYEPDPTQSRQLVDCTRQLADALKVMTVAGDRETPAANVSHNGVTAGKTA